MKIAVNVMDVANEPHWEVPDEHVVAMMLRPGFVEIGLQRSDVNRVTYDAGEMALCPRQMVQWVRRADAECLVVSISDAALTAATNTPTSQVELRGETKLVDARIGALLAAVNAERIAGFPSGHVFLDSVERALAAALIDGHGVRRPSPQIFRGGLTPSRLRKITELVHTKIDEELTLEQMAEAVSLSVAHFSQMFRKSTGQSPHQFVLKQRIERAKELLRKAEARVIDVAVACGFKTQQHFARVFRQICGTSPTQYRREVFS
jgi:AraC family transcriptional regulator